MSDSLWPHVPQHARPPCPSPTPRVPQNPCPLSWWCHPTISSSVVPFSSCPQSFPAPGSFQMSQLFSSGGQSTRGSASKSVLPMNTQDWSPLGRTGWISLHSKGLSRVFTNITVQKYQLFGSQPSLWSNSHIYTCLLEKHREGNGTPLQYFCLENPVDRRAWWAAVHGVARVGHNWATSLSLFTFMHWRRKWQPTPVFLPGESQGWGSLVGCPLWGRTESDTTKVT